MSKKIVENYQCLDCNSIWLNKRGICDCGGEIRLKIGYNKQCDIDDMSKAIVDEALREFIPKIKFDELENTIDPDKDMVNHPPHYNQFPFEVLEAIHTLLGTEGYKHYLLGNELKYRLRAGFKDKDKIQEDIDKALFYNKERKRVDSDSE